MELLNIFLADGVFQHLSCLIVFVFVLDVCSGYNIRQCINNHVIYKNLRFDDFVVEVYAFWVSREIVRSVFFPWLVYYLRAVYLEAQFIFEHEYPDCLIFLVRLLKCYKVFLASSNGKLGQTIEVGLFHIPLWCSGFLFVSISALMGRAGSCPFQNLVSAFCQIVLQQDAGWNCFL